VAMADVAIGYETQKGFQSLKQHSCIPHACHPVREINASDSCRNPKGLKP
jgi:hypothetical protein